MPEHLSTFMFKTWKPSLLTSRSFFSLWWKHVLSETELKGYSVAAQGSGAAGKWDGQTAVGHLGATTLRTFLPCHFLSIMIDIGNAERGGAAVAHGNRGKRMSKHWSAGCHILPEDFQVALCVKLTLVHIVSVCQCLLLLKNQPQLRCWS